MKTFSKEPGRENARFVSCPVCGSTSSSALWTYKTFRYVRCINCSLLYQNPQPIQDDLTDRYDQEYFEYEIENEDRFFGLMELGLNDIDFDNVSSEFSVNDRNFLDIGCATGRLISELKKKGWNVQGVEVCVPAAEHGIEHNNVPIYIGTLESAELREKFSVVHCSHLIEHLTDPVGFVDSVKKLLKPRGRFIITTPNVGGFQAKLMKSRWRSAIADHMVLFSKRTLRMLLTNRGFSIEKIKTWGGIGMGITKDYIKKPIDRLAKKTGLGDVMIILARFDGG